MIAARPITIRLTGPPSSHDQEAGPDAVATHPRLKRMSGLRVSFGNRGFLLFLAARFIATIAIMMLSVAVGWQVYAMTGNPLDLGLVGLAQFAPFVPLALLAGAVADRHDRRRIISFCYGIEMLCSLFLLGFTLLHLANVWPIYGVMILYGSARAFLMPASQAVVVNLVPAEQFGQALAINSSAFQIAIVTGPALGGVLYLLGPEVVYGVVATSLALAGLLMLGTGRSTPMPRPVGNAGSRWSSLLEGIRYVRSRRVIMGAISLDLFAVLFGGATALLPAFANDVLQVGPAGLGLLRAAPGLGATLTALLLAVRPIERSAGAWMFGGVALFGLACLVFGFSRNLWLSLVALALMGAGDMISVFVRHLLVQVATPDAIRGRVSAVNSVFIGASNELGEFESGLLAAWLGLVPAVMVGGGVTLAITFLWMLIYPELRRMDRFPRAAEHE